MTSDKNLSLPFFSYAVQTSFSVLCCAVFFFAPAVHGAKNTGPPSSWGLDASVIKIEFTQAFLVSIVSRNGNLGSVFNTYTLNKAAIENVQFFFHLCVHESKNANYLTCGRLKRCAFQHISFALQWPTCDSSMRRYTGIAVSHSTTFNLLTALSSVASIFAPLLLFLLFKMIKV